MNLPLFMLSNGQARNKWKKRRHHDLFETVSIEVVFVYKLDVLMIDVICCCC